MKNLWYIDANDRHKVIAISHIGSFDDLNKKWFGLVWLVGWLVGI